METTNLSSPEPTPPNGSEKQHSSDRIVLEILKSIALDPSKITPDSALTDINARPESVHAILLRIDAILAEQGIHLFSLLDKSSDTTVRELQDTIRNGVASQINDLERHPQLSKVEQSYSCLKGERLSLTDLSEEEQMLVTDLQEHARTCSNWNDYQNYWTGKVLKFYPNLLNAELQQTIGYRVGQDLGFRLALATGKVGPSDYRDELVELIRKHFKTRREFCEFAGLTESILNEVLSGRKNLSLEKLQEIGERIGYQVRFMPRTEESLAGVGNTGKSEDKGDATAAPAPRPVVKIDLSKWQVYVSPHSVQEEKMDENDEAESKAVNVEE